MLNNWSKHLLIAAINVMSCFRSPLTLLLYLLTYLKFDRYGGVLLCV